MCLGLVTIEGHSEMCSFITQHNATDVASFDGACNWHAQGQGLDPGEDETILWMACATACSSSCQISSNQFCTAIEEQWADIRSME